MMSTPDTHPGPDMRPGPDTRADVPGAAEGPATGSSTGGCAHCDNSVPHEHVDVRAAVGASRSALASRTRRDAILTGVLAALLLAVAILAGASAQGALLALLLGGAGWLLATALGVLLAARGAGAGRAGAVVFAAVLVAALVPLTGYLAAWAAGHAAGALAGAAGWLLGAGTAQVVRTRTMRRLLLTPGAEGEPMRQAATLRRLPDGVELGWLTHPAGVAAWGLLGALLPITLVLTTALHIALTLAAAVRARRGDA